MGRNAKIIAKAIASQNLEHLKLSKKTSINVELELKLVYFTNVMSEKVYRCQICRMTFKLASDIKAHFDQDHDLRHPTEISVKRMEEKNVKLTTATVNDVKKK